MTRTLTAAHGAARLDRFLAEALGVTRSAAKRVIDEGSVERFGKRLTAHDPVRVGDLLTVNEPIAETSTTVPPDPVVLERTPEYLVLEKPAGLLVHPAPGHREPTLVDWLRANDPSIAALSGERPGIVHRLDREVSGVMVVARTVEAEEHFRLLFASRQVGKRYRAVVLGSPATPEGEIAFPLAPSRTRPGVVAARPRGQAGRDALTRFTVLAGNPRFSYLDLELVTGRTHQLRAHLAAIAHPIVGDARYGGASKHLARPFLHAYELSFPDLSGTMRTYHSPFPRELAERLTLLVPEAVDPVRGIGRSSD